MRMQQGARCHARTDSVKGFYWIGTRYCEESYIGWWSAAAFHGFTTQKPATVFVAVKRQTPARTIEGAEIRFVSVEPRKFFGSERYTVYGRNILISDPEKTVTDCIDLPCRRAGGTIARPDHSGS
jgi:predicted transcriptional regulator of viral defense system